MELLVYLISGLKVIFLGGHNGFIILLSDSEDVTVGVPQGSILGVLLFSLYVNDLPHAVVSSDIYQYADDILSLMFYCNSNFRFLEKKLLNDIHSIIHWLVSNK